MFVFVFIASALQITGFQFAGSPFRLHYIFKKCRSKLNIHLQCAELSIQPATIVKLKGI